MITIVDGSLATQLERYISEPIDGHPLWTSRFVISHKEECIRAHRDMIRAGAEVITTATYQGSVQGFMKYLKVDEETAIGYVKESVALARRAIQEETGDPMSVKVAAHIGPYGAYLHDGSEYTGSYMNLINEEELAAWHRPRINAVVEAGVDILAFETIPGVKEARVLVQLMKEHPNVSGWMSFSGKDPAKISIGEMFKDVAQEIWALGQPQLLAVGVNCLHPKYLTPLFTSLRAENKEIPLLARSNSCEVFDESAGKWIVSESDKTLKDFTEEWVNLGVKYLGGCCRTVSEDILNFKSELVKRGMKS